MKKLLPLTLLVVISIGLSGGLLFGGGAPEQKEINYLRISWDKLVEAAKKEAALSFYVWWAKDVWQQVAQDFKARYGIEVTVEQQDSDTLVKTILDEKNKVAEKEKDKKDKLKATGTIDAVLIGRAMARPTVDANVFYGPLIGALPDAKLLDPKLSRAQGGVETNGYLVPLYRHQMGFLYAPEKVSNPPQTWFELIDWMFAHPGQLAFADPSQGDSGKAFVQTALVNLCGGIDKYWGDTEVVSSKVANWDEAWKQLWESRDLIVMTSSKEESIEKLSKGEVSLIVITENDTEYNLRNGTLPRNVKFYVPKMGFPGGGDTGGVLKTAPHKAAAILFLAYLTEQETQKKLNEALRKSPARTDITGRESVLSEEDRRKFGVPWMPFPYQNYFTKEFDEKVMQ